MANLRIIDLEQEGYLALVEEIRIQQKKQHRLNMYDKDLETVNNTLSWMSTSQGHEFWSYVNRKEFDKAIELSPKYAHIFEKSEVLLSKEYTVIVNGLFKS